MTSSQKRSDEAARWVAKLDSIKSESVDEPITWLSGQSTEFANWVNASLDNRTAFLLAINVWQRMDIIESSNTTQPSLLNKFSSNWRQISALAASVMLITSIWLVNYQPADTAYYSTGVGGKQNINLEDGSSIKLNTNSRMSVNLTDEVRQVELQQGEAFFEIAPNKDRPFVVTVNGVTISVLGTAFSVFEQNGKVEVIVSEGRVQVHTSSSPEQGKIITKGDRLVTQADYTEVNALSEEEVSAELAWQNGKLQFQQARLDELVEEFNRYNQIQMEISDPTISSIKISGTFSANNPLGFSRLIKNGFGLSLERKKNKIFINN